MKIKSSILFMAFLLSISACSSPSGDKDKQDDDPKEPEIVQEYDLSMTIKVNNIGNNFANIQFVYNYTDDLNDTSYTWNMISSVKQNKYEYSLTKLDGTKNLYFKVYVWDRGDLGAIYVGDVEGKNFLYAPRNKEKENITIEFEYPTNSSTVVGKVTYDTPVEPSNKMSHDDVETKVYGTRVSINPKFDNGSEEFTASYKGENIRIDNNKYITGLKAGSETEVTLNTKSGLTCKFKVTVADSNYKATSTRDGKWASSEKWFSSTKVGEISKMGKDFMHGVDISSYKSLLNNGTKFFNAEGKEQSLFYILKDAGVNWIRLKIWVDPYTSSGVSYGGGDSDINNTLWMAKETKAAGLKLLLDFHYSDYWTHPNMQILPKSWADCKNSTELADKIEKYTKDTLTVFKNSAALPDMVQLGNEISSGSFLQLPGKDESFSSDGVPGYVNGRTNASDAIRATSGSENMIKYLSAASRGVDAIDKNIKKIIHWAKGSTFSASVINNFYSALSSVNYDYAGLSIYPYYCVPTGVRENDGGIDTLNNVLSSLNISKPWFIAETSYPFSGSSWVYENYNTTNLTITDWTTNANVKDIETMRTNYPFTPSGQAKMIHDINESVVRYNGLGVFYWEGAWVPNAKVGWAGPNSGCSWSNQGFFSYDGKCISNIDIFKQISPFIG